MTSMDNIIEANITCESRETLTGKGIKMVFVLGTDKTPLDMCHESRARKLLDTGKAAVFKLYPFTIIMKDVWGFSAKTSHYRLKIDPGSKFTGFAILKDNNQVVWAAELQHRGSIIKKKLDSRRASRRSRRNRKTRYRQARWAYRKRQDMWLVPSIKHRILTVDTWVRRLLKLCNISDISIEWCKFDTQKMDNPDVTGIEYQQGELLGYEIKEYLLQKWDRKCAYCGKSDVPLEIEHILPKSRGGSNKVSNLTIACKPCNQKKGNKTPDEWGKPLKNHKHTFMKDMAVINSIRKALVNKVAEYRLPLELATGATTKFNRHKLGVEKAHWIDACCVGKSTPDALDINGIKPLNITCKGHGSRQMCAVDKYGFPCSKPKAGNRFFGFRTGDIVKANKNDKIIIGRLSGVRKTGSFSLGDVSVNYKQLEMIQNADGYSYKY